MKNSITIDSRGQGIDDLQWLVGKVIWKKYLSHGNKFKYVSVYGVAIKNDA